jgi:hypothetical protein
MVSTRRPFSLNFVFGSRKKSQGVNSGECGVWGMTAISYFARNCWVRTEVWEGALSWWSCQVRSRHSSGATSSHVSTQSSQNFPVEPGIHSLARWDKFFVLPQLLYRWRLQSGIFWIPSRISPLRVTPSEYLNIVAMEFSQIPIYGNV